MYGWISGKFPIEFTKKSSKEFRRTFDFKSQK